MKNYLDRSRSCNAILLNAVSALYYYPITTIKVEWPVISQSRFFSKVPQKSYYSHLLLADFCISFYHRLIWLVLSSLRSAWLSVFVLFRMNIFTSSHMLLTIHRTRVSSTTTKKRLNCV